MTNYLTPGEVERLHDTELSGESDLPGVDHGRLGAAVTRCQASAFGEDAFPTIHDKAAALFTALIQNHPFTDGNKRTAVIATHTFYLINGFRLVAEAGEIVGLALSVAQGYADTGQAVDRLSGWAQPIKYDDD